MDHKYPTKSVARMDLQFAPERSSFRGSDGAMFDKLLAERDRLLAENKALREALELIATQCEDHPAYLPDASDDDMMREGGDAASITYWAHTARAALAKAKA